MFGHDLALNNYLVNIWILIPVLITIIDCAVVISAATSTKSLN